MEKTVESNENRKIIEQYFKEDLPIQASELIERVKAEGKLPKPQYKVVTPNLKPDNLPIKMGFSVDPKIANLVVSLNKLGYQTIGSCEGHPDRGDGFPSVDFWGTEFYKVMALIDDWAKTKNIWDIALVMGNGPEEFYHTNFGLFFHAESLEKSQSLAQDLSDFINSKS